MFDYAVGMVHPQLSLADVVGWVAALRTLSVEADDGERIDRIRALEDVKNAICAAQAREAVALKASVVEAEAARGDSA